MAKAAPLKYLCAATDGLQPVNQRYRIAFGTHPQCSRNAAKPCANNKEITNVGCVLPVIDRKDAGGFFHHDRSLENAVLWCQGADRPLTNLFQHLLDRSDHFHQLFRQGCGQPLAFVKHTMHSHSGNSHRC